MSFEIGLELASNNQDLSALTPFLKEKDRKPGRYRLMQKFKYLAGLAIDVQGK